MPVAVLFDVDGTLIDSNDAHARAWVRALEEHGVPTTFEAVRPLIGMGGDLLLAQIADGIDIESARGKEIEYSRKAAFADREFATIEPTPGAREALVEVRRRGARVVIATSAKSAELDKLLAIGEFGPLVDVATTSDDADASKPEPDIIIAALRKAAVSAADAIMIGDTKYDIEAAHRAHVACVALRCGGNDPATLQIAEAVYADPFDLVLHLDRPPFSW